MTAHNDRLVSDPKITRRQRPGQTARRTHVPYDELSAEDQQKVRDRARLLGRGPAAAMDKMEGVAS